MKSFYTCLLPALALSGVWSAQATTVLSGHITHPQGPDVHLIYEKGQITGGPRGVAEAKLDAKGNFRVELPKLKTPTVVTFSHGQEYTILYLTPGDNLTMSLDAERFDESVRYTGTGANPSNYLAQNLLKFDADPEGNPLTKVKTSSPAAMRQLADDYRRKRLAFLSTYAKAHPLTPAFRAYARQTAAFDWANTLFSYPEIRKEATPTDVPTLPATYYDFLAAVRPSQDSALRTHNDAYLTFLETYVYYKLVAPGEPLTGEQLLATTRQQFGNGPSRDLASAKYVYQVLSEKGAPAAAPLLPAFRQVNRDSALAQGVRALYAAQPAIDKKREERMAQEKLARQALAAGKDAPAITVRDASGKTVSLADYKGKVVYLDFWASWCGPCMAEVPAGVALKKQFEGKDVVFLYVSIDDKEDAWKKALSTHPLSSPNSVHTLDKGWDAPAPKAYQVHGIPAYFLIGRDGRLAADETPRPSEGEKTVALLNEALARK
ncbi:TlpA family protein disulfide reductase [Hymenobacter rubidus]|uniref:TlpA family protein disulfide reductase n=1 Tax=Hymenobacter rubidus TaxID=1441626 RepID=UPI00293D3112|nr:TlpA disulfide reductase family protein [Hymenobacter rubidus]